MAQVLVVAFSPQGLTVSKLVVRLGHDVITASSAPEAIEILTSHSPDLLISELRLGAFNGIQLLIRHQRSHPNMRAIILDSSYDPVLAGDVKHQNAAYLVGPIDEAQLAAEIARNLREIHPRRRWRRKRPTEPLLAQVADQPARVLDLSYGGMKLEAAQADEFPPRFHIVFPNFGVAVQARPIWTHPAPTGSWWCGAEVSDASPIVQEEWRQLVDSVREPS